MPDNRKPWCVVTRNEREAVCRGVPTGWQYVRDATPDQIADAEATEQRKVEEIAARQERHAQQDWRDAEYLLNALEHDRERAIELIGVGELHRIAQLLREADHADKG